jgi:DHA1 family bicyclomycin/chloramphenicol resistance-like MFS transporter
VTVPAIVRDRCKGKEAAHLFAMIGLIMIIAPAIAPSIGSTILAVSGWRSIFVFLACYGGLVAASLWFGLFAHLPPHSVRQTGTVQEKFLNRYITVLKHPLALRLIVIQAMVFSVMLIFLTHASFIYQQWFGLSAFAFSLLFAGNIIVMAAMNTLGRKLLVHYEPAQIVRWAVGLQALAVIMLVLIVLVTPPLYLFAPALMLAVGSLGAVVPNVQASFMHFFEHNSGTASALLGAVPLILTGLISGLSTVLADGTLLPLAGLMLICSVTGLSLAWGVPRRMQIELAKDMAG